MAVEPFVCGMGMLRLDLDIDLFLDDGLDREKEPRVVVASAYDYLVFSLGSLKLLRGHQRQFNPDEVETAMDLIKANNEMLKRGFEEMLKEAPGQ